MASYKILSQHYEGPPSVKSSPKVDAKDIKSGPGNPPTVGSFGHAAPTQIFTKEGVVTRTANNRFVTSYKDYERNGYFSQPDDRGFGGWIKNGTNNYPNRESNKEISSVPMPKIADIEGIKQERMNFPNAYDTPTRSFITPEIYIGPINDRGRSTSGVQNKVSEVLRFLYDGRGIRQDNAAWLPFLESVGIPIKRENPVYAIGVEHDVGDLGHIAAYYPNPAKRYLVFESNFDKKVRLIASSLGIPVQDIKDSTISHESLRHGKAEIEGERPDERLQGLIGSKFHTHMADIHKGTDKERTHRRLAEWESSYADEFSFWNSIKDAITQSPHSTPGPKRRIAETVLQHGIAKGKRGKELIDYVKERVDEVYGPLDEEPSYKDAKDGGLEAKLQKESPQEAESNAETAEASVPGE